SAQVVVEIAGRHDIELSPWENQLERLAAPNPVARRMWRAYLGTTARFDEPGIGMHPARGAVLGGVPLLGWSLVNAMTPVWGIAALGAAAVLSGLIIAQMAPSFVRERESATLEPLVLSALSPREIVGGKLLGVALITARLGLWPVVALAIWGLASGLAMWSAVLAMLVAQLGFAGGVAAWASLRFRQASVAAGVAWGAILFAWVVAWWSAHRVTLPIALAIALWASILALGGALALWSAVGQLTRSFSRR
ncbi:MAG: ABC transporter permease, partial [Armatimonadetes bacterium]|nr:ABC transporter permease [Armatimonadota bacterium]